MLVHATDRLSVSVLAEEIAELRQEICDKILPHRQKVPKIQKGKRYAIALINYTRLIDRLAHTYHQRISALANKISYLGKEGWQENPAIVQLWMELARTVEYFRHNPVKGVGSVYVAPQNKMLAYGPARFAHGLILTRKMVQQNRRRRYLMCGEREAVRSHYKIHLPKILKKRTHHQRSGKRLRQLRVFLMHRNIVKRIESGKEFKDSILFTTAPPCTPCSHVVIKGRVKHVYVCADYTKQGFTRLGSMHKGQQHLHRADIKITLLEPSVS